MRESFIGVDLVVCELHAQQYDSDADFIIALRLKWVCPCKSAKSSWHKMRETVIVVDLVVCELQYRPEQKIVQSHKFYPDHGFYIKWLLI